MEECYQTEVRDKETPTLTETESIATALCYQRIVHNDYLFSAQGDLQVHLVQTFGGTAF